MTMPLLIDPMDEPNEPSGSAVRRRADDLEGVDGVRVSKPRRAAPADAVRPTRAEVNLANLRYNLGRVRRVMASEDAQGAAAQPRVWGVLKADAYGHGAPAVARTLERAGMPGMCVALLEEGIELRQAGIVAPILVMGGYYGPRRDGLEEVLAGDLIPTVYDPEQIDTIAGIVRHYGGVPRSASGRAPANDDGRVAVHIKLDTGMGRLGATARGLDALLQALRRSPEVRVDGLMTHFACADGDDLEVTREQLARFDTMTDRLTQHGILPRVRHAANSAALLRLPETRLDMVRPGLALFGLSPRGDMGVDLRPVMRVRSEIVALRTIEAGQSIGYGHTFTASRETVVATVPMGYADGLSRKLSNVGHALVHGKRAPIIGTVSMDLTMIDVTDMEGARISDEVVFLGSQEGRLGRDLITADEIAEQTGTIAWEVLTSVSRRVPRFYREP